MPQAAHSGDAAIKEIIETDRLHAFGHDLSGLGLRHRPQRHPAGHVLLGDDTKDAAALVDDDGARSFLAGHPADQLANRHLWT